jgi:hypothetical protein
MTIYRFPGSAAVAQLAVNQLVVGSNPTPGAMKKQTLQSVFVFLKRSPSTVLLSLYIGVVKYRQHAYKLLL